MGGVYPMTAIKPFFGNERRKMCPFLRWDAPYLSDGFLRRPSPASCGVVLDIGANIGLSSLPPAALGWRVIAFEPNAYNVQRLRLNLALNGFQSETHVHVVHAAVSNTSGEATLFSPAKEQFAAVSSLSGANLQYFLKSRYANRVVGRRTRLVRLDEYIRGVAGAGLWQSVGVIKLDVQGHELSVLRGMGDLLGSAPFPVLLMEYEEPLQVGAGFHPMEVLLYLRSRGYRCFCPLVNRNSTAAAANSPDSSTAAAVTSAPSSASSTASRLPAATLGSYPEVLHFDTEAMRERVLPGTRLVSYLPSGTSGSTPSQPARWRLGSELEPQAGKPSCIDAIFLHEKRLVSNG